MRARRQILTAANWETYVPDEHKHVVVEFYAPWFVPPSLLTPTVPQRSEPPLLSPSRRSTQPTRGWLPSTLPSSAAAQAMRLCSRAADRACDGTCML
jgi:hypothetical protein